jgi:hypothetical protein
MSMHIAMRPPAEMGLLAFGLMLGVYFGALTLVSGWTFTFSQFSEFWVGLAFNVAGIAYIGSKLLKASREHARCLA